MRTTHPTQEIPKAKWPAYFITLSEEYQGWATTIEVIGRDLGDQRRMDGLPLQGISYDPVGSQAGDVMVEAGDAGTPFETHLVRKPSAVRVAITQPGGEVDLELDSEEGYTTLVRLRPRPGLPPPR
jgi:hypothetical protein